MSTLSTPSTICGLICGIALGFALLLTYALCRVSREYIDLQTVPDGNEDHL